MSTPEENAGLDLTNESVVTQLLDNLDNKEIANLPLGSPEQKAALAKAGKTDEESATSDEEQEADDEVTEDDESEETEESGEETEEDEVKKKPKKGIQKRFDEMTTKIRQLEAQLQGKSREETPEQEELPKFEKKQPKLKDFESVEDFYSADAEWRYEKAEFERSAKTEREQQKEQIQKVSTDFETKAAEFKKTTEDFDEVVNKNTVTGLNVHPFAIRYIMRPENNNPEVLYKLLSDEAKAEAFRKADGDEQIAILTEIKLGLTSKTNKKTTVTAALEPPPQKKKGAPAKPATYRDDMSWSEFERTLDAELNRKSKRR